MQCLYVVGTSTECPLTRGVRLREVSVSGDSAALFNCTVKPLLSGHPRDISKCPLNRGCP